MKNILLIVFAVFAVSCSTSNKKESSTTTTAPSPAAAPATPSTTAKPATKDGENSVLCKNGPDERMIKVQKQNSRCEVLYTKFKETNSIATSVSGTDHCDEVSKRVRSNLEGAGFKCE